MADTHRINRQITREVKRMRAEEFNRVMTAAYNGTVRVMSADLGRRPVPAEITAAWAAWLATYESTD